MPWKLVFIVIDSHVAEVFKIFLTVGDCDIARVVP
jgi:hypothetical protein